MSGLLLLQTEMTDFSPNPSTILQLVKLGSRPFIIHLTPEKGTPFERSLAVLAIVGNNSRPFT